MMNIKKYDLNGGYKILTLDGLYLSESELDYISQFLLKLLNHFKEDYRYHVDVFGRIMIITYLSQSKVFSLFSSHYFLELGSLEADPENGELKNFIEDSLNVQNILPESLVNEKFYNLKSFANQEISLTETQTLKEVAILSEQMNEYKKSLFEKMSDFFLTLTANYSIIRNTILKFLVILPWLDFDKKGHFVKKSLLENLVKLKLSHKNALEQNLKGSDRKLPSNLASLLTVLIKIVELIPSFLVGKISRFSVELMAQRFIAGASIGGAKKTLKDLYQSGRSATLDQLGELVVSSDEADDYFLRVLEVIKGLSQHYEKGKRNSADIPYAHVSIKVSALSPHFKPEAWEFTYDLVAPRLKKILIAAKEEEVFVNIDAEHYRYRDLIFTIYKKVLLETPELKDYFDTGIVVQAYLRDAFSHLKDISDLSHKRNLRMPIRLVKGAYFDAETIEADAHHYQAPQFLNKEETDLSFRQLAIEILEDKNLSLAVASHNIFDHLFPEVYRRNFCSKAPVIEHQCLHMTYEALSVTLAKQGFAVRNYMPIGNLIVGMAYLVRRIIENSSQVGVLTIMRSHFKTGMFKPTLKDLNKKKHERLFVFDSFYYPNKDFKNTTPVRFYKKAHLDFFKQTINNTDFTKEFSQGEVRIISPNDQNLTVGMIDFFNSETLKSHIEVMLETKKQDLWRDDINHRVECLYKLGQLILKDRFILSSLMVKEAGKTALEALADVDEAVDFIYFYATQAKKLFDEKKVSPKGLTAVIAPWNFPLAIPVGMSVASLAVGNKVILKSSENTPLICEYFSKLVYQAGISRNTFLHAPGSGSELGPLFLDHQQIAMVVFTGSLAVGKKLYQRIYQSFYQDTQSRYPKELIAEMGGKNAVIVSSSSDLDEAINEILYSSFAHAGQKCSACSRILVAKEIKDKFIKRFVKAVRDLPVGVSSDFKNFINPVITLKDQKRIIKIKKDCVSEVNKYGGKVHYLENDNNDDSFTVKPAVFELPAIRAISSDSFMNQEIFGPIVHITSFDHPAQAVKLFNANNYALTGGIFSGSEDEINYYAKNLKAGNLYINRANTGARVGIEPFGGFMLSGTGPKAGGIDYLDKFAKFNDLGSGTQSVINHQDFGSDYLYQIPRVSYIDPHRRVNKISRIVERLIMDIYYINNELDLGTKETLKELKVYFDDEFIQRFLSPEENVKIPGQLSYNTYDMPAGPICFLLENTIPSDTALIHFLIALALGDGIVLLCTNSEAYQNWLKIFKVIRQNGISNLTIDVYHISREILHTALRDNSFEYYFFDTNNENIEVYQKEVASNSLLDRHLPKFYHPGSSRDFNKVLKYYCYPRSFAVNIMRHGAPLE